jgi:drug/metabolite transporter (DMT)-like permease
MTQGALAWRLLVISAFWGAGFPLIRHVAAQMPPLALATARGVVAVLAVGLFLGVTRRLGWPRRGMWRHVLVIGTCNGWLPNLMTAVALAHIGAGAAAMIQAATPLMVAGLAALLLREERPGRWALLGLLLGFLGIGAIVGPAAVEGGASLWGAALMLATALSYSLGTIYLRRVQPQGAASELVLGQQVVAAVVAGALSLGLDPPGAYDQPREIWLVLVLLGVLGSAVPLTMFMRLVQQVPATRASVVGYLQPVWATLLGAALLAEWPEARVLAGGAVVILGVWLATMGRLRSG